MQLLAATAVAALVFAQVLAVGADDASFQVPLQQQPLQPSNRKLLMFNPAQRWGTRRVGSFYVAWDRSRFTVTHESEPQRILWSTVPLAPFLSSASGIDDFGPGDGNFDVKQTIKERTSVQSIASFQQCKTADNQDKKDCAAAQGQVYITPFDFLNYTVEWTAVSDNDLRLSFTVSDSPNSEHKHDRLFLTYALDKDEQVYGLGEQFTYVDLVGQKIPIVSREQGVGRGLQPFSDLLQKEAPDTQGDPFTTYTAVPHYITSRSRSVFIENEEVSVFDFTKRGEVDIQVISRSIVLRVQHGKTPKDLVELYTASWSGRMQPLPEWLNSGGAIAGFQGGRARAEEIVSNLKNRDVPLAAIWIQDWCGTRLQQTGSRVQKRVWWNWDWDRVIYPNFPEFTTNLKLQGVRTLVYVNPFLADVKNKSTGFTRNFHDEAAALGHLVLNTSGIPYGILSGPSFDAALVDLRDPLAFSWLKGIIKENILAFDISGFMHDFGEWMPMSENVADRNGINAIKYHNRYPVEWSRLTAEVIAEAKKEGVNTDDILYFSRSAGAKSPGYSRLFWAGDQLPTWDKFDGIKSALIGMLTSGLSGFSLTHSDIGAFTTVVGYETPGLTTTRSRELLFRWMELAAFTAAYRTHEGSVPAANAQFYDDEETYRLFGVGAKIYVSLAAYRRRLMKEAYERGYPLMRFLWFEFPEDHHSHSVEYQFMLGPDLLVAPVLDEGAVSVEVYLPQGLWIDSLTGEKIVSHGEKIVRNASIGRPVTFIRGSVPADLQPFVHLCRLL